MPRKRHNGFNYQQIVVLIFILLNGLFTVAPFVHASAFNNDSFLNQTNEVESNILNNLQDEQQECHFVLRNKQKFSHQTPQANDTPDKAVIDNRQNLLHNSDPHLLIRHPFYSFLSIYYLF